MRTLAIIFNIGLFGIFLLILTRKGIPSTPLDMLFVSLLFFTPLFNLFYIFSVQGNSLVALYFKRKALEEQKKIDELNEQ